MEADVSTQGSSNLQNHGVVDLIFTQIDSAKLFLVGDAFAKGLNNSLSQLVLTDIQILDFVKSFQILEK